jgi:hypothetical protein
VQLHRAREQFEAAGVRLVLIGQATPRHAAHFRRRMSLEAPVLADEQRVTYKAIGARKASIGELVGPRMLAKGAVTSARYGVVQGRTIGHPAQLGGALVITPDDQVVFEHLAQDAGDNVSVEELLAAV